MIKKMFLNIMLTIKYAVFVFNKHHFKCITIILVFSDN